MAKVDTAGRVMRRADTPKPARLSGSCAWRRKSATSCPESSAAGGFDPELAEAQITVTEVRIGPDLKRATAFITRLGRSDADALLPALGRAAPYLRGQVAHALRLRVAPELTFKPDLALDYAMKIDELMHRPEIARDLQPPPGQHKS